MQCISVSFLGTILQQCGNGLLVDPKHPSHRTSLTPSLVVQCVMCRWLGRRIPQKMPAPQVAAKSNSVK